MRLLERQQMRRAYTYVHLHLLLLLSAVPVFLIDKQAKEGGFCSCTLKYYLSPISISVCLRVRTYSYIFHAQNVLPSCGTVVWLAIAGEY